MSDKLTEGRKVTISGPRDTMICPICNSVQVRKNGELNRVGTDNTSIYQKMRCVNCDATWEDHFRYVSYTIAYDDAPINVSDPVFVVKDGEDNG